MNGGLTESRSPGEIVQFPASPDAGQAALDDLELVYGFIYARVGNRADAEDLTQQVAMKALPRIRTDAEPQSVRAYLFATARSVLATFWSRSFAVPEAELTENLALEEPPSAPPQHALDRVARILDALPPNYRRVLELRFLRGYSLKEAALEMGTTTSNIKVMQLRALRAAAGMGFDV